MTSAKLIRRASTALLTVALAACGGDSTAPSTPLTETQVADLLEAMSAVSSFGTTTPFASMASVNVSETVDCPNGGTAGVSGSVNANEATGSATIEVTQRFNGCKATSSEGRVWTFDGYPNITTSLSLTFNQATQAVSISGTQKGAIRFSSDLGSGICAINLAITLSGDGNSFAASLKGTACGHTVDQSISATP